MLLTDLVKANICLQGFHSSPTILEVIHRGQCQIRVRFFSLVQTKDFLNGLVLTPSSFFVVVATHFAEQPTCSFYKTEPKKQRDTEGSQGSCRNPFLHQCEDTFSFFFTKKRFFKKSDFESL